MKKLALLPLILFFSLACAAQEKYVEVVVTDTMLVEPQEWVIYLNVEEKYDFAIDSVAIVADTMPAYPSPMSSRPAEIQGISLPELSSLVKKYGGRVLNDGNSVNYNLSATHSYRTPENRNFISASFNSRKSLEAFLKEAAKPGNVVSQVTATINPKVQDFQALLDKKLMNMAKLKALRLADLGGGKLGPVLLISEATEPEGNSLKNFLETMMKLDFDRKNYSLLMNSDKIKLEKSLKVRFAIL